MTDEKTIHIDDPRLAKVVAALRPGNFIEVKGNGGPMTIGAPSPIEDDPPPLETYHPQGTSGSWLD